MRLMYGDRKRRVDWFYAIEGVIAHENLGFDIRDGFEKCLDEVIHERDRIV